MNDTALMHKIVLLVEDHADTAEMLSLILETEGYRVQCAATASEALQILSGAVPARFDLVLLDLTLPDMNGDDMIRTLKKSRAQLPPVLIMSAKPAASLEDAARAIGAAGIVRKPFDIQVLLESIQSELNKQPS